MGDEQLEGLSVTGRTPSDQESATPSRASSDQELVTRTKLISLVEAAVERALGSHPRALDGEGKYKSPLRT